MAMAGLSAKELSENATLMVLGRIAMIVVAVSAPVFGFVGTQYFQDQKDKWAEFKTGFNRRVDDMVQSVKDTTSALNQRVDGIDKTLNDRIDLTQHAVAGVDSRVTVLETTTQATASAAANDRSSVSTELHDLRSSVDALASQVSAINATISVTLNNNRKSSP